MRSSVARVFNQRGNDPLHVRTIRFVSVVNEPKAGGVNIGSIANSHGLICCDPLSAGEESSAASCKKGAKQKPKHWIADSTFLGGSAAVTFLARWRGYRQSGRRLPCGVVSVITGYFIFTFHWLPSSEKASSVFALRFDRRSALTESAVVQIATKSSTSVLPRRRRLRGNRRDRSACSSVVSQPTKNGPPLYWTCGKDPYTLDVMKVAARAGMSARGHSRKNSERAKRVSFAPESGLSRIHCRCRRAISGHALPSKDE